MPAFLLFVVSLFSLYGFAQTTGQKIDSISTIKEFSPQGATRIVKDLKIIFSQSMKAWASKNNNVKPIQGSCLSANSFGYWQDDFTYQLSLDEPILAGMSCEWKSLTGQQKFSFHVQGPNIKKLYPDYSVDPKQIFLATLDGALDRKFAYEKAYFVVEGIGDRIALAPLTKEEQEFLQNYLGKKNRWSNDFERKNGQYRVVGDALMFKAAREFPYDKKVTLVWPKELSPLHAQPKEDQKIEFTTLSDFKVTESCSREALDKPCIPILPIDLYFTSGIQIEDAKRIQLIDQKGVHYKSDLRTEDEDKRTSYVRFKGPFPENSKLTLSIPTGLIDEIGRTLVNEKMFPLHLSTGGLPSLMKFSSAFGIYESEQPVLPVTLRHMLDSDSLKFKGRTKLFVGDNKALLKTLQEWTKNPYGAHSLTHGSDQSLYLEKEYQRTLKDEETEVIGLPLQGNGLHLVELESLKLGKYLSQKDQTMFVRSAALVTDMNVVVKRNDKEALVWVTSLKTTMPIANAEVQVLGCSGDLEAQGITNTDGLVKLKARKSFDPWSQKNCQYGDAFSRGFFVFARKADQIGIVDWGWNEGITSWRFGVYTGSGHDEYTFHTILDRDLIRPGETLHMKHLARQLFDQGMGFIDSLNLPKEVELQHVGSGENFKIPLKWNVQKGYALSDLSISEKMKLGTWSFVYTVGKTRYEGSSFQVANYQIPLVSMNILAKENQFVRAQKIPIQLSAEYLAGGPADKLAVKVEWSQKETFFKAENKNYQDFVFLRGGVEEGIRKYNESEENEDEGLKIKDEKLKNKKLNLDQTGGAAFDLEGISMKSTPQMVLAQVEYRDPSGETQFKSKTFTVLPSPYLLGIRSLDKKGSKTTEANLEALLLDQKELPVAGKKVKVNLYRSKYYSHRKRLIGGFYSYESFNETLKVKELCSGVTNAKGLLACHGQVQKGGQYIAVASFEDENNVNIKTNISLWLRGHEPQLWNGAEDSDRMDLIPNKASYEPGETAEISAQVPFAKGHYLLTVERQGVIESKVIEFTQTQPVIHLPILKSYQPNVFVSVFALRGRSDDYQPTSLIDLGRPTFRMGLKKINVMTKQNKLSVKVKTDAKVYQVRGMANATITVRDSAGKPARGDVAIAVIDDGLLYLSYNKTWDFIDRFFKPFGLGLETSTSLMQVVGKRHYGKKALPIGGDGRGVLARENFDPLLLWRGSVQLNQKGEAQVQIPLNDSLTSFRVVAIATSQADQFGTGTTSFKTTQETITLSSLPQFLRENDQLNAQMVIRNMSQSTRNLAVEAQFHNQPLELQHVVIDSKGSAIVNWPITAPKVEQDQKLLFQVTVRTPDGKIQDRLKKFIMIRPLFPLRPQVASILKIDRPRVIPLTRAVDEVANSKTLNIELKKSLQPDGLNQEFWQNYRYNCLEQKISRAIALHDLSEWQKISQGLSSYISQTGLLQFFPEAPQDAGYVGLTSYYLLMAKLSGFEPANSDKLLQSLGRYLYGHLQIPSWNQKIDQSLKLKAAEALAFYQKINLEQVKILPMDLPNLDLEDLLVLRNIMSKMSQWKDAQQKISEIDQQVQSRILSVGQKLNLEDQRDSWIQLSDLSSLFARLLLWEKLSADELGKTLNSLSDHSRDGVSTFGSAWLQTAFTKIQSKVKSAVQGHSVLTLAEKTIQQTWKAENLVFPETPIADQNNSVQISHVGSGAPWAFLRINAREQIKSARFAEMQVKELVNPSVTSGSVLGNREQMSIQDFEVRIPRLTSWVVFDFSLPPGTQVDSFETDQQVQFEERRYESFRAYFRQLPTGTTKVRLKLRFNQKGIFQVPGLHLEEMYSPLNHSDLPAQTWKID